MASPDMIGLMTHQIISPDRFIRHARAALAEGFDEVAVFAPGAVDRIRRRIVGLVYSKRTGWKKHLFPFPTINMDIGSYTNPRDIEKAIQAKSKMMLPFTSYGLGNKMKIQKHLLQSSQLQAHLLPTCPIQRLQDLLAFADRHCTIMLKPINGKGGQGIVRLSSPDEEKGHYVIKNNDTMLTLPSRRSAAVYVKRLMARGPHLMQQWIDIRNAQGNVYDIRALVQKNGKGFWQLTGMAVREGRHNQITSNLKTGGHAFEASSYLKQQFGEEQGEALTICAEQLAEHIPLHLEQSYGIRLSELGIDLAVDRGGALWLLEVNIKPGRRVIQHVYGDKAFEECFRIPFRYARHLLLPETSSQE